MPEVFVAVVGALDMIISSTHNHRQIIGDTVETRTTWSTYPARIGIARPGIHAGFSDTLAIHDAGSPAFSFRFSTTAWAKAGTRSPLKAGSENTLLRLNPA